MHAFDRQTDGQTDTFLIAIPLAFHAARKKWMLHNPENLFSNNDDDDDDDDDDVFVSVKEVVCFGEGAGANILTRFAVSIFYIVYVIQSLENLVRLVNY